MPTEAEAGGQRRQHIAAPAEIFVSRAAKNRDHRKLRGDEQGLLLDDGSGNSTAENSLDRSGPFSCVHYAEPRADRFCNAVTARTAIRIAPATGIQATTGPG